MLWDRTPDRDNLMEERVWLVPGSFRWFSPSWQKGHGGMEHFMPSQAKKQEEGNANSVGFPTFPFSSIPVSHPWGGAMNPQGGSSPINVFWLCPHRHTHKCAINSEVVLNPVELTIVNSGDCLVYGFVIAVFCLVCRIPCCKWVF